MEIFLPDVRRITIALGGSGRLMRTGTFLPSEVQLATEARKGRHPC